MIAIPRRVQLILAAAAVVGAAGPARASEAVAAPVAMHVTWAAKAKGEVALRDDIARSALDALSSRGCFSEVLDADEAPGEALWLEVELDDLRAETIYDDSLAETAVPSHPDQALRVTAVFSVMVRWSLSAPGADAPIAAKRFKVDRQRRPIMEGEDSAAYARGEAIETVGRELARAVCSVSRRKIEAALRSVPR